MTDRFTQVPLESDRFYHLYNRGNNHENIFFEEKNYKFFLKKYQDYLMEYVSTYAFCLLPNHFHFLIKVHDNNVSNQLKKFFQSYVKSINNAYGRSGSLFLKNFKRIEITKDDYLKRIVYYIHYNPEKHKIVENFRYYKYSSYKAFIVEQPTKILKNEVFEWFGSKEEFIEYHQYLKEMELDKKIVFEE